MYKVITQTEVGLPNSFFAVRAGEASSAMRSRGSRYKLVVGNAHYRAVRNSLRFRGVNLWNSLPDDIVGANSPFIFKKRLDLFIEGKPEIKYQYNGS